MSENILGIEILVKNVSFFSLTLRKYDEKNWGKRVLSFPIKDRFALDFGHYSLIFELWFLGRKRNGNI